MATVLRPMEPRNLFEGFPQAIASLLGPLEMMAEDKKQQQDQDLIKKAIASAGNDPAKRAEALRDISPQLTSKRYRPLADQMMLQDMMQKPVYDASGNPVIDQATGKPRTVPENAHFTPAAKTVEYVNPQTKQTIDLPVGAAPPPGFERADIYKQDRSDVRALQGQAAIAERQEKSQAATTERMLTMMGLKADQKTDTEISLAAKAANGDKAAIATLETLKKYRTDTAAEKAKATQGSKTANSQAVKFYGDQILAGNPFPMGMGAGMREAVGAYVQTEMDKLGNSPQDIATRTNIRKALGSSVANQEKMIGMMGGFVKNIDKQVDRVSQIEQDVISRVGVRALDLPLRELKTKFVGSGHEKVLEAYMTEISNEIGKLSTGSSASVRELSTEAQERWAKIHDPNLSFKELKTILEETKHMGQMRLESSQQERDFTVDRLKNIGAEDKTSKDAASGDYQYAEGPGGTKLRWKPGMTDWEAAP